MKCDTCWFHCVEPPAPDQPHMAIYCAKGHWDGGDPNEPEPEIDPWKDCADFEIDPLPY